MIPSWLRRMAPRPIGRDRITQKDINRATMEFLEQGGEIQIVEGPPAGRRTGMVWPRERNIPEDK